MKSHSGSYLFLFLVAVGSLTQPVAAQSLFGARGLGVPLEPIDARSRGLGGVALGFPEPEISWANPAAAIGLAAPGIIASYQYDAVEAQASGASSDITTARFPLLLGAFPISNRLAIVAGYGGFLDQNWRVERPDSLILGVDTVPVTDILSSEGGVARIRAGAAYEVVESLGIGLALDFYTGSAERIQGRLFPEQTAPVCCRSAWNYGGVGYTVGLRWTPSEATGLALSVNHGGTLDASPTRGEATAASYDLPLIARAGASGRVGQTTMIAVGGSWGGWSVLDDVLTGSGGARDAWSAEAGIEYEGLVIRERTIPLRLGGRTAALPFRWDSSAGDGWADERAVSIGAGAVLAGGGVRSDLAVEFGDRGGEDAGLDESFWRFAFSVRVLGL